MQIWQISFGLSQHSELIIMMQGNWPYIYSESFNFD